MVAEKDLEADKIEIGVLKKHITKEAWSTITTFMGDQIELSDGGFSYVVADIPIEVKIIKKKFKVLVNPDTKFYMASEYRIPNPFKKYLKIKQFIKW